MKKYFLAALSIIVLMSCHNNKNKTTMEIKKTSVMDDNRKQQIDTFFNRYALLTNKGINEDTSSIEQAAAMYSESFIGANPSGVRCGENDKKLIEILKKTYASYHKIGITSMEIVSKEITLLDDFHEMTKIRWKSNFVRKDGTKGSVEFDDIYLTQFRDNQHKVFGWITEDEQAVLKEQGLI